MMLCMSNRESERPEPNYAPGGLDSEADLRTGGDNGPDILQGYEPDEPNLADVLPESPPPFRTPVPGSRLNAEQLERDIE
jgi:hypothetical protein